MTSTKLYCYVDETGQDTEGKLFIVVAVITEKDRDDILLNLEKIESESGKYKRKWINTRKIERNKYIEGAFLIKNIKNKIYFRQFNNSGKNFEDLTVLTIGQAINLYVESHKIDKYRAVIVIDGLNKTVSRRVAKSLRELGVSAKKVRGERDESNSILRLADSVAGLVRDEKRKINKYVESNIIYEL